MAALTPHRVALLAAQPGGGGGPVVVNGVATAVVTATGAAVGSGARPRVHLPAGVHAPDDYTVTAGAVVNDCTSAAGWENWLHSGEEFGVTSVETVDGSVCVSNTVQTAPLSPGETPPYWLLNLPADATVGAATRLVFETYWVPTSSFPNSGALLTPHFTVKAASAVDLGGTVASVPFPGYTQASFNPVEVPLAGLSAVRSVAFMMDGEGVAGAVRFSVREIRFANETPMDKALAASSPSAVIVGPAYEPGAAQDPRPVTPDEVTVDLRPGHVYVSRLNGARHLREWAVPEDGDTEVSAQITRAVSELGDHETLVFPAGGLFRVERPVVVRGKRGVTIDCNGSRFYWSTWRGGNNNVPDPGFAFTYCTDSTFKAARVHGWRDRTYQGSALVNDTGTPTTSGTTKTLDAQNEAVRTQTTARWYMRHLVEQFTPTVRALIEAHDPTFAYGTVALFRLSDTAQVAGDVALELVYADDDTVAASRTVTVTGAPADYALTADPDPRRAVKVRARKATSTTNTVTVHEVTEFGFIGYDVNHDSATAVAGGEGVRGLLVEDVHVEGASTDGFDFTHSTMDGVTLRNVTSRGACRQGMSFNYGSNVTVDGFTVGECGRSAVDIEPYGVDWWVRGVNIRHGRVYNATNYAFAMNNWEQITRANIDDIDLVGAGIGLIIGGGVDSTFTNVRSDPGPNVGAGRYALFRGIRMRVSGVTHRGHLVLGDEPAGQADNLASDITVRDGDLIIRESWSASNVRGVAV